MDMSNAKAFILQNKWKYKECQHQWLAGTINIHERVCTRCGIEENDWYWLLTIDALIKDMQLLTDLSEDIVAVLDFSKVAFGDIVEKMIPAQATLRGAIERMRGKYGN